jgi:hypothetical protein
VVCLCCRTTAIMASSPRREQGWFIVWNLSAMTVF